VSRVNNAPPDTI